MKWLLRFLAWATVLAVPSWWIGGLYHRMLATISLALLGIPTGRLVFRPPDIPASHALGVYAALCLASTRAPRARRWIALASGVLILIAIEVLTGTLAIRWELEGASASLSPAAMRLRDYLTSLPAWIGAPLTWLVLLGRYELPGAAPSGSRPTRRPRDPGGRAGPRAG